jgi:hypothetical protein
MTSINLSTDIPSQINTVEKLSAWCSQVLASLNPSATTIEGVGYTERIAQSGVFYVAADNKYRRLIRLSLEVSPDHESGGLRPWQYVQEISNTAIPAAFKAN